MLNIEGARITWVEELKQIESVITWEDATVTRKMTEEDQNKAAQVVEEGTDGVFRYYRSKYGYRGSLYQQKLIPWGELYNTLLQLPFCQCEGIMLPFDEDVISKFHISKERADKYRAWGCLPVEPFVRKEDKYIVVSLFVSSRYESYDEDGYGGGDVDEYAVGIIDPEGRWALPFKRCDDVRVSSIRETSAENFIPIAERTPLL